MAIAGGSDDGKTLNYAFIEVKDLASARRLVRERGNGSSIAGRREGKGDGGRIGQRPCSVVLSSAEELRKNVGPCLGNTPGMCSSGSSQIFASHVQDLDGLRKKLAKLCSLTVRVPVVTHDGDRASTKSVSQSPHVQKAPERPFLHLVSALANIDYVVSPNLKGQSPKHEPRTRLSVVEGDTPVERLLEGYEKAVIQAQEHGLAEVMELMASLISGAVLRRLMNSIRQVDTALASPSAYNTDFSCGQAYRSSSLGRRPGH